MKSVFVHRQFAADLLENGDPTFAKRMFSQLVDELDGSVNKKNDHRFEGIEDAWIRYASRGRTALRIIYLVRQGRTVFYRCGVHSVEDRVSPPTLNDDTVFELALAEEDVEIMAKPLSIISSYRQPYIYSALLGRRLIPNRSVYLVSPFIEPSLLSRGTRIGQTLDSIRSSGAEVVVISCAEEVSKFAEFHRELEARDIELVFVPKLHSKIYLFITDNAFEHFTAQTPSLGIVGSSNLTASGIPATPETGNIETNYAVDVTSIGALESVVMDLYYRGKDYKTTVTSAKSRKYPTR